MTVLAYVPDPAFASLVGDVPGLRMISDADGRRPAEIAEARAFVPTFFGPGTNTAVLDEMPELELIQLLSAGAERWVAAARTGVTTATARGAHGASTAEWALAAVLAVVREFPGFVEAQRNGVWSTHTTDGLAGKRAVIVGAGDIGERIAVRLRACDVDVTLVGRTERPGVHPIGRIGELLPRSEIVVLIVPLTGETRGLVDAAFLAQLPDKAIVVNAARGPVVDTAALLAELMSGRLRAALDVTDPEPLPAGHPLWSAPNVFLTPHVGGAAVGSMERAAAVVREQLGRFAAGEPVQNAVGEHGY